MYNILALGIGALLAVMISMNGSLGTYMGNFSSNVLIHLIGLITLVVVILLRKTKITFVNNIPFYFYSGGAIGVFTVLFNNITFATLGVSLTISLGLLGQLVSSLIIDHFGLFGMTVNRFNQKKLIGLTFILAGIVVMALF